ncbi:MAG: hypothetical protein P1U61_04430 [Legionellaceae bacterium]|nr:hypothetical protein [Legionellaceae bacterium]
MAVQVIQVLPVIVVVIIEVEMLIDFLLASASNSGDAALPKEAAIAIIVVMSLAATCCLSTYCLCRYREPIGRFFAARTSLSREGGARADSTGSLGSSIVFEDFLNPVKVG